jgi:ABC-type Zn uptake system ZnuABC Zn-binding protein ZnuA
MRKYVVHDAAGNILKWGVSSEKSWKDKKVKPGETKLEVAVASFGPTMDVTQKVVGDKIVAKTLAEIEADKKL